MAYHLITAVIYLGIQISQQNNAYSIHLNDKQIGVVEEEKLAEEAFNETKLLIEEEIKHPIHINEEMSINPIHVSKKELMTKEELITQIQNNITCSRLCNKVSRRFTILKDKKEAEEVIDTKNTYIKEGTEVRDIFVEEVVIEPQFVEDLKWFILGRSKHD